MDRIRSVIARCGLYLTVNTPTNKGSESKPLITVRELKRWGDKRQKKKDRESRNNYSNGLILWTFSLPVGVSIYGAMTGEVETELGLRGSGSTDARKAEE